MVADRFGAPPEDAVPEEARRVLDFWFAEMRPAQWWTQDDQVDEAIRVRFSEIYEQLAKGIPKAWLETAHGQIAAIIVLDQFPRNLFRGSARSFATDAKALRLTQDMVDAGLDEGLSQDERAFAYLPFEHSEDTGMQERSVALFEKLGDQNYLDFAVKHKLVIDRFGRFPHRNAVLGRKSTGEEEKFLKEERWFW